MSGFFKFFSDNKISLTVIFLVISPMVIYAISKYMEDKVIVGEDLKLLSNTEANQSLIAKDEKNSEKIVAQSGVIDTLAKENQALKEENKKLRNRIDNIEKPFLATLSGSRLCIELALENHGTINTNNYYFGSEEERKLLFLQILIYLSTIGQYNGSYENPLSETPNAVMDFQRDKKLKDDGIIGKNTWEAMEAALKERSL